MAALTANRDTLEKASGYAQRDGRQAAPSTQFYRGGIVVLDPTTNTLKKAFTGTGLIAMGRCEDSKLTDASGTMSINCRCGVYKYANSTAGDLIAGANIGADCYIVDDQTVALTSGGSTRSRAGEIYDVDADGGVWVAFTFPIR